MQCKSCEGVVNLLSLYMTKFRNLISCLKNGMPNNFHPLVKLSRPEKPQYPTNSSDLFDGVRISECAKLRRTGALNEEKKKTKKRNRHSETSIYISQLNPRNAHILSVFSYFFFCCGRRFLFFVHKKCEIVSRN